MRGSSLDAKCSATGMVVEHLFTVGASGFEPPTSWSRSGDRVSRRTTEFSTNAVSWTVGVVPRELKSPRSSEKLTPKLTPRATSWTDSRRSLLLQGRGIRTTQTTGTSWIRPLSELNQGNVCLAILKETQARSMTPPCGRVPTALRSTHPYPPAGAAARGASHTSPTRTCFGARAVAPSSTIWR